MGNIIGWIVPPCGNENPLYVDRHPDIDQRATRRFYLPVVVKDVNVENRTITTANGVYKIIEARIPGGGSHLEKLTL